MGPFSLGPNAPPRSWSVILLLCRFCLPLGADFVKGSFRGLYTTALTEAHETVPMRVDHNGGHLSYNVTTFHSHPDESIRFNVTILEQDHHLILKATHDFLAPNIIIEWRKKYMHLRRKPGHRSRNCHFQGMVHGHPQSRVALSTCNGLAGMIQTNHGKYYLEPAYHPDKSVAPGHPHLVYKRSAVSSMVTKKKRKKKRKRQRANCGTREPKRWTELEWKRQLGKVKVQQKAHKHKHRVQILNVKQSQLKKLRYKHISQREKRSVSKPQYVETLLVADSSMVDFHQDGDIETYILTIMNMVSSFYQDPSIGNYINVVVVKIILIDDVSAEPAFVATTNADTTLKNFCKWQRSLNPGDDSHPHHHDVAILLTRKDICARQDTPCGTLGVAHIGGMCKATRSCSVNEDNGITSAHTIAHEMGHNFGMLHDTEKTGCKRRQGNKLHIMTPSFEADTVSVSWSNCSRREITNFLELQFGTSDAVVCSPMDEICARLWCQVNETCTTLLRPAAPGTHCGKHKWCQEQKCVPIMDPPTAIDGGWGEWSAWSECSRTCGSGVSIMQRECDHPSPSGGGKFCVGERKRYKICNTDPCPEGQPTFRAVQCSWHNNRSYEGKKYEWQPYFDQGDPCQLYCSDANETLIVPWGDYAADGTPCSIVSRDICISGICKKVGCDWVVDSTATEDDCGICNGDGTRCDIVRGEYKKQSSTPGYGEVVVIPSGARNIRVEEKSYSENYIGIESALKKKFYLNGKRHITLPGEYSIAGTQALYERENHLEKIRIPGPIKEPIVVSIFFRGKVYNPGVTYKYSIWKPEVTKQLKYTWILDEWSQCSATCGGGTQYRLPQCQERTISPIASELETPNFVEGEMCDPRDKPDKLVRTCNDDPCPSRWWIGPWQACPVTCSAGRKKPMKKRNVMCVDDRETALPDQFCDKNVKPIEYEPCARILPCDAYE
ncbi:A disintegrin and metalloproteinase with thrombospondin motifs 7 isoform X2 [Cylas formicarius]|uniref:A disintegrin and metalloproteinase with thrombospondin motifs 7 isoform X2 n=1 Tax=Cylas formicarius TaxID=197179 RepID=UPI00295852CF|nr:A disintegrin and metalloproteinase with thrombospondin motifs 7 isoform X2 [Cylas formicarius]